MNRFTPKLVCNGYTRVRGADGRYKAVHVRTSSAAVPHTPAVHSHIHTHGTRSRSRTRHVHVHVCTGCTTHAPAALHTRRPCTRRHYMHTRALSGLYICTRGRYTTRARPRMTRARPVHGRTAARDTRTRTRARTRTRVRARARARPCPRRLFTRHSCHRRRRRRPAPPRARAAMLRVYFLCADLCCGGRRLKGVRCPGPERFVK